MKKRNVFYLLMSILLLCGFTSPKQDLKITYLGNCSYLYESAKTKVVIDPFGTEYGNYFYLPSNETKQNIIKGYDSLSAALSQRSWCVVGNK